MKKERLTLLIAGTSRCDVPARVQRAERIAVTSESRPTLRRYYAARTAQRAVPTVHEYRRRLECLGQLLFEVQHRAE